MRSIVLGLSVLISAPAMAQLAAYSGRILYDSDEFPPSGTEEFRKALGKASSRSELAKDGDAWNFNFVAVFKRQPGATSINLVFYDVTGGGREYVNVFEIEVAADQSTLLSKVVLLPTHGFQSGKKYKVLVTRLIGGKEKIFAGGTLKLK